MVVPHGSLTERNARQQYRGKDSAVIYNWVQFDGRDVMVTSVAQQCFICL